MSEYHRTIPSSSQTSSARPTTKKFGLGELAQRYGVADMMNFSRNNTHANQTVDEEFLAYTTAAFRGDEAGDTEILAFWEVSPYFLHLFSSRSYALHHRIMNTSSRRSMQLR